MKTSITLLVCMFLFGTLLAQQPAYTQAVGKGLKALGKAKTVEDMQQVANQFERIAHIARGWTVRP